MAEVLSRERGKHVIHRSRAVSTSRSSCNRWWHKNSDTRWVVVQSHEIFGGISRSSFTHAPGISYKVWLVNRCRYHVLFERCAGAMTSDLSSKTQRTRHASHSPGSCGLFRTDSFHMFRTTHNCMCGSERESPLIRLVTTIAPFALFSTITAERSFVFIYFYRHSVINRKRIWNYMGHTNCLYCNIAHVVSVRNAVLSCHARYVPTR